MDFSIQTGLAIIVVGLACGRCSEQLLPVLRGRRFSTTAADSLPHSPLGPLAGAAAVTYAHAIGSDSALLITAWVQTATATFVMMASRNDLQTRLRADQSPAQKVDHE